ncbi:MAG: fibronectin type III domain-containing protein [Chloroflexota bacterium]|nr:fibronectin type III domain-containing protein [Chloroflexota bacterium]
MPAGAPIGTTAQPSSAADTAAPAIAAAAYAGATLTLTMSEPVWAEQRPPPGDFVVRSNAVLKVTKVGIAAQRSDAGKVITLTLAKAVSGAHRVLVSYVPNRTAARRPRDAAGNRMGFETATALPRRTLSAAFGGAGESGIAEDAGEVDVTISLDDPPDSGSYTGCRLRLAADGVADAADVELAEAGLALNPGNGWRAGAKLLRIVDDALAEGDEALAVEAHCTGGAAGMEPSARWLASESATATIVDNESRTVALAAAPSGIVETAEATPVTVTATLDGQATEGLDLPLTLSGTATADDYSVSGTKSIAIAAGAASGSTVLTIDPAADQDDVDEAIAVDAVLAGYAVTGAEVAITEPAPPPRLVAAVASSKLNEDAGKVTVRLTLRNPPASGGYTGCGLRLAAGSVAESPADVTFPNQKRLRAANGWTAQGKLLNLVDDALTERNEALVVEGRCKGREPGTEPAAKDLLAKPLRLTIRDNDGARPLTLSVDPATIGETLGGQAVEVTATVADAPPSPVTVSLRLGPGAYSATGALRVVIPAGSTSGATELTFTPTDDGNASDDTVAVSGTAPGHTVADASLTIAEPTVVDGADLSGLAVRLTVSPAAIREGSSGGHRLNVRLDGVDVPPVDVSMAPDIGGTATRGSSHDYRLTGAAGWRKLTVKANDAHLAASSRVTVAAFADSVDEGDETVTFTVSQVTWGTTAVALDPPAVATLRITEAWETPKAPKGLSAAPSPGNETHGLDVSWSAVAATPPVEGYVVRYREVTAPPSAWREAEPQPGLATAITGLNAGTRYELRAYARSAAGDGPESGSAYAYTADGGCPMSAPSVSAAAGERSSSDLSVSWQAPACGASVAGYRLRHREDPDAEKVEGAWTETAAAGTAATLTGLAADTSYVVAVRAVTAGGDKGPWSPEGKGRTGLDTRLPPRMGAPAVAPHAVDGASRLDATWTRVTWTDPNGVPHLMAEYQYRHRADGGAWTAPAGARAGTGEASAMTRSISGLAAGTWHEVQVRAVNRAGGAAHPGKWSEPGRGRTWGAPDRVEEPAAYLTGQAVEVVWEAPHDGGSPITDYDVDYRERGSTRWRTHPYAGCAMGTCAAEASINGLARQVRVRAGNALGMGKWSRAAKVQSRKLLRASYGTAAATVEEGESLLVRGRLDGAADRGVPARVRTTGGAGAFRLDGLTGQAAAFGLGTLEQTFTFAALQDTDDVSEKVTLGFGTLPDGVSLAAPASLVVTINDDEAANGAPAFASGAAATRTVAENAAAGTAVGAPLTATDPENDPLAYTLGGTHAALFTVDASSGQLKVGAGADLDFEGAANSHSVTVEVGDGKDASGAADASADDAIAVTVNVTDVAEPPSAPAAPTLTPTATTLGVAWTEPDNTGPAITGYELHRRASGEADWTDAQLSGTATAATLNGLSPGTAHEVRVRAANDEGTGAWSASAEGNTLPAVSLAADDLQPEIADGNAAAAVTLSATAGAAGGGTLTGAWLTRDGEGTVAVLEDGIALADGAQAARAASSSAPGPRTFGFRATHALDGRTRASTEWLTVNWRPRVILSASPSSVAEDGGPTKVTVTARLTGTAVSDAAKTVAVSVAGGTAKVGDDFEAVDGFTIKLAGGARSADGSFTLTPVADSAREGPETVSVAGTATDGSPVTVTGATVSIVDADPKLTVAAPSNGHVTGTTGSGDAKTTVIDCGSGGRTDCAATLAGGTEVALTATADDGYLFSGWTGACSGAGACTVTVSVDTTVGAKFAAARKLTVAKPANGKVVGKVGQATVIDCGSDCAETVADGTSVALSASPSADHRFDGWGGACASETTADCSVTLNADRTVSVAFASTATVGKCDESVVDGCAAGTLNSAAHPDTDADHHWRCDGANGGANSRKCTKPKAGCSAGSRDWSASGNDCTGSVTGASSGQARSANDGDGPATGSASFKCDDGAWTEQSGSVCGRECAAQTRSHCDLTKTAHGGSSGTCDADSTGNCSHSCSNGVWTRESGQCNARCPTSAETWTVGDDSCTDTVAGGVHGITRTASDGAGSARGTASYLCSDGDWLEQAGSTCERECGAATHTWRVGSAECSARLGTLPSGWSNLAEDDRYPDTGSARYECADGTWTAPTSGSASCHESCEAKTIDDCVLENKVHNGRSGSCAGGSGACSYTCVSGNWSRNSNSCQADCATSTETWTVDDDSCSASVTGGTHGATRSVNDPATGTTSGSATFECNDGDWDEQAGSTCNRECSGGPATWKGANSTSCSATLARQPHGGTSTANDQTILDTGSATYQCDDGDWGDPASETCDKGCAGRTIAGCPLADRAHEGSSGGTCVGDYSGTCSYSCSLGAWSAVSACRADCAGQTIDGCTLTGKAHGGTSGGTCGTGYQGSCSYSCGDGSWTPVTECKPELRVSPVPKGGYVTAKPVAGDGISCGSGNRTDCVMAVPKRTTVNPSATARSEYESGNWTGCDKPEKTCRVTVDAPKTISATFTCELTAEAGGPYTATYIYIPALNVGPYYLATVEASASGCVLPYSYTWQGQSEQEGGGAFYIFYTTGDRKKTVTVRDDHDNTGDDTAVIAVGTAASSAERAGSGGAEFSLEVPLGGDLRLIWGEDSAVSATSDDDAVAAVSVASPAIRVTGVGVGRTHVILQTDAGKLRLPVAVK